MPGADKELVLALDFGGTKLAAAVGHVGCEWLAHSETPAPSDGPGSLTAMVCLGKSLLAGSLPAGIGVSFGGHVDVAAGTVRRSVQTPGWESVALGRELRRYFGAPVAMTNDANAGALGEWQAARPTDHSAIAYVTVSTGIGAGLVVDGNVIEGADGLAGEIGHIVVDHDGEGCLCGRRGCAETVAAGPAIARRAAERSRMRHEHPAGWLPSGPISSRDVARAAEAGDPIAIKVFVEAGEALAEIISALIAVVNPGFVAVGGGVACAGPVLWDPLHAALDRLLWPEITTSVMPASSSNAPLSGAFVLGSRLATQSRAAQ